MSTISIFLISSMAAGTSAALAAAASAALAAAVSAALAAGGGLGASGILETGFCSGILAAASLGGSASRTGFSGSISLTGLGCSGILGFSTGSSDSGKAFLAFSSSSNHPAWCQCYKTFFLRR